jgi:hypothetical protein
MTKEEAVREELKFGREQGTLNLVAKVASGVSVQRLEAIADGNPLADGETDYLFDALGLDEDSLEDEPDPEAPSERDGVRTWVIQYVDGVEGPSLCLTQTDRDGGTRFAGPKPWGGGRIMRSWKVNPEDVFGALGFRRDAAQELAAAVETKRKEAEEKGWIVKPSV